MRQAGRYLPEYRALRAQAGSFLAMVQDPELAAEVTLQPVRRFGLDAAILFSDILLPLQALGMELAFDEGGPTLPHPLRTRGDVEALRAVDPRERLAYVGEALTRVRAALPAETALIGFAGAPFTLAAYAVEGGTSKAFLALRTLMARDETTWEALMERLAHIVAEHLVFQVERGAEALVLFDTWAGILTREDYRRYAEPWTRRVAASVATRVPLVLFAGQSEHLFEGQCRLAEECGAAGVAVDHRTDLAEAFRRSGGRMALQGNLDPAVLLARPEEVFRRTRALLEAVGGRHGHILNLGHGVLQPTEPECVAAMVEATRVEAARTETALLEARRG
jgi:uroporphyrinogen decarboxylase